MTLGEVYAQYVAQCEREGHKPVSLVEFSELERFFYARWRAIGTE